VRGVLVLLGLDQFQQLVRAAQPLGELADAVDGLVEQGALAAQGLRAFGVVPDVRAFQLAVDFLEPLYLGVVVKDTPSARQADRGGR